MSSSRRRSVRIHQKLIDSETSDINTTDDESTSQVSIRKGTPRKYKTTPKSTKNISRKVENIPPTVLELAEQESDSDKDALEIVEKLEEPKSRKTIRGRKKIVSADRDEEDSGDFLPIGPITIDSDENNDVIIKDSQDEKNTEGELSNPDTNFIKLASSSEDENEIEKIEESSNWCKYDAVSDNLAVTQVVEVARENLPIKSPAKKMSRFKVDLKKYESNFQSSNSLLKLGFELKNSAPFRDHLRQIKNKSADVNDVCGLHGVQLAETEKEPKIKSNLKIHSLESNLKSSADKETQKLMKKSVLPADMEKEKNCPIFNQSKQSKNREMKKNMKETAGPAWYNLPKTELTDEVKRDLQVIKMRSTLDGKQHYKRSDSKKFPKFFQMGTIVEGSHEFYSSRMSKKDRKRTMVDELLADAEFRKKNKKRMIEYEMKKGAGGKAFYKKKMQKRNFNKK